MKFRNAVSSLALLSGLLAFTPVIADDHGEGKEGVVLAASRTFDMLAVVEAIDHETREVTLNSDGETISFVAGEQVKRLDEIQQGDEILIEINDTVALYTVDAPGLAAGVVEQKDVARATDEFAPAGIVRDTLQVVAVIEAVDHEAGTVTLSGPEGNSETFRVDNPANLEKVSAGDRLVAVFSESVAAAVVGHQESSE